MISKQNEEQEQKIKRLNGQKDTWPYQMCLRVCMRAGISGDE